MTIEQALQILDQAASRAMLPIELEAQAWLNATKGILDFWDNDEDAAYDDLSKGEKL